MPCVADTGILIVMVVGMAVDYAVHFTHFYNEAHGNRFEKAQGALHGVGVSVVGGAVTTAGAALPLIFAPNFQFFHQAIPLSPCCTVCTLCVSAHQRHRQH